MLVTEVVVVVIAICMLDLEAKIVSFLLGEVVVVVNAVIIDPMPVETYQSQSILKHKQSA